MAENSREQIWPALDYSEWRETCATLQLWTQIVGKIRPALGPWINHRGRHFVCHGARVDHVTIPMVHARLNRV
jgi:hypothetical protein